MQSFFGLTYFRQLGQKYRNIFVSFLVQMKTSKSNSEINRPLQYTIIWLCSKASKIMFCQPKYNHCTHVSERNIWVNSKPTKDSYAISIFGRNAFFQNIWTAVNVLGVIEKCCSNPFNVQTAIFFPKPHKVIESRTSVKKANLECYWNNFVLLLWRHVQLSIDQVCLGRDFY